jgi:Ca-activated chloride channel homolog
MLHKPQHIPAFHPLSDKRKKAMVIACAAELRNTKAELIIKLFFMLFLCFAAMQMSSQEEKKTLHTGNEAYFSGKSMEAARYYKKSLKENGAYHKANFNLGDALYKTAMDIKTGKVKSPNPKMTPDSAANLVFDQAAEQFEVVAKSVSNGDTIQKAWHNYGNAKLMQKNYEDAVSAYKKSLKINPKDEDTRYNLAYALSQMKQQQKNQDQKDNKDNKDKKQQQNKKEEDNKQVNNNKDKNENKAQQPEMSKEQAEKILNELKNSERKLQAARKKKDEDGTVSKPEKDW